MGISEIIKRIVINAEEYNGSEPVRKCPKCGEMKPLSEFGFRNMGDGTVRNQSWCIKCRGKE